MKQLLKTASHFFESANWYMVALTVKEYFLLVVLAALLILLGMSLNTLFTELRGLV